MRIRKGIVPIVAAMAIMLVSSIGHTAQQWPATKAYVAGSVGFTVALGGVQANDAAGAVDCATGTGGVCFDATGHEGQLFSVTAKDDTSGNVGIFMGFDRNGDGCVRCLNGTAGQPDNDVSWQGGTTVTGQVPCDFNQSTGACKPLANPILYVFVRVATLNTGDMGTTGTITIVPGCATGRECKPSNDPTMGQVCTPRVGTPAGQGDCQQVMYPYPGH